MKVVIIGGGTAGISTATHLRRKDENARIVVLEKSDEFAVATCGLPYYLSGAVTELDDLKGATPEQMEKIFKIEVKLKYEVVNINRENKKLIIDGGEEESYDKLVIATGALQLRPDIPGILSDNIFTLRNLESAQRIKDYYLGTGAQKVLILGGGDIGVEAAEAMHSLGAEVTIAEAGTHILKNFDADMTAVLQNHLRNKGIKLHLNTLVTEFREKEACLNGETLIDFDMAIIATGVKPDVKLPVTADITIGESGGITVNDRMQTNDENIYACGDNVEILNKLTGKTERLVGSGIAIKQARTAADNIAGLDSRMEAVIGTSIIPIFGMTAAMAGCSEATLKALQIDYRKIHLFQRSHASYVPGAKQMLFKLLFSPQGKILGVQGIGEDGIPERINAIAAMIKLGASLNDMINTEIPYAPPYSGAKDAINNLGSLAEELLRQQVRYVYAEDIDWTKSGNEILLIDTRNRESFLNGHIAHAINIPLAALRDNLGSIPRDKQVILYCQYGYGAYNAYWILTQRGFDNVYLLSGSMDLFIEIAANEES